MKMREVAYFLKRLDETTEANGKTILENSLHHGFDRIG